MYNKKKYEHSDPDGYHDLFVYGDNEDYLLFLQQFFLDVCSHKGCSMVFYGPEETCQVLKRIVSFWKLGDRKCAVTISIVPMESFSDPHECFNRKLFLISLKEVFEASASERIYSCVDMNLPLSAIRNEKAIVCFIDDLNRACSGLTVNGVCSLFCLNIGKEHERRNFIRQFRKVYFPEKVYRTAGICRLLEDQIDGAERGIAELLAGSRPCSENLFSGMFHGHFGEHSVSPEKKDEPSEERFLKEVLWISDQRGRLTYVSSSIKPISGRDKGMYIGKNILDAVSPENIQVTEEIYRTGIRHSRKKTAGPLVRRGTFIVRENRRIFLKISILPIKIDTVLIGFMGSVICEAGPGVNTGMESSLPEELTERDLQIIEYLFEGYSSREIGDRMALAEITIKKNLTRIYRICNVVSRTELLMSMCKR